MILKKDITKKNLFLIFLISLIIFSGTFLRLYKLDKTYSEYDDIFMIALHKNITEDKEISFDIGPIKKSFNLEKAKIQNLETSILFPFYIGYTSTYSPAQFAVLPFLYSPKDNYETKIFKTRILPAIFSILILFLLPVLFYKIEGQINLSSIFVTSIYALSINSILYAHHGSTYSIYSFSTLIGIWIIFSVINKRLNFHNAFIINSCLLYFSYLNIFFFIPIFYLIILEKQLKNFLSSYIYKKKIYLFSNFIILFPILTLFFLKNEHEYSRGVDLANVNNFFNLVENLNLLIQQLYLSFKSLSSGFVPYFSDIFFFVFCNFIVIIFFLFFIKSKNKVKRKGISCCLIYFAQWILLYCFNIIPLDQTRHSLVFFPVFLMVVYLIFSEVNIPKFIFLISFMFIPFSLKEAKLAIDKRVSLFDFKYLEKQEEQYILSYDSLPALIYFQNSQKKPFYTALKRTKGVINELIKLDSFLVVGHHHPLILGKNYDYEHVSVKNFKSDYNILFENFNVEILIEKITDTNLLYNGYDRKNNNPANGFFVYKFVKKIN